MSKAWFERSNEVKARKYTSVIFIFQKGNCSKVLLTLRRSIGRKVGIIGFVADKSRISQLEAAILGTGVHFALKGGKNETWKGRTFVSPASLATAIASLAGSHVECKCAMMILMVYWGSRYANQKYIPISKADYTITGKVRYATPSTSLFLTMQDRYCPLCHCLIPV